MGKAVCQNWNPIRLIIKNEQKNEKMYYNSEIKPT